ncbi:hypothetical protein RUM44_009980 [Polyplax serrata]|uniref:Uncharacterized protein n=1 Tax=Polyplax serrata TaxID=468196 RepID=A0ABR1AUA7_POLSC
MPSGGHRYKGNRYKRKKEKRRRPPPPFGKHSGDASLALAKLHFKTRQSRKLVVDTPREDSLTVEDNDGGGGGDGYDKDEDGCWRELGTSVLTPIILPPSLHFLLLDGTFVIFLIKTAFANGFQTVTFPINCYQCNE